MTPVLEVTAAIEFPACALCGSEDRVIVYGNAHDLLYGTPGYFDIVRCRECGLVYLCPRPTPECLGDYYPEQYGPFSLDSGVSPVRAALRLVAQLPYCIRFGRPTLTLRPFGRGRMLDVGCGGGAYLARMQALGWDVYGVDPSEVAVRHARNMVGTRQVYTGTIESLDAAVRDFDLITMLHCLEHVPSPSSTLREAHDRLAPGGLLRILVPDVSGFEAKVFGRYWTGLDVPRHLYDFSGETLLALLDRTGFVIESWRPQFWPTSVGQSSVLVARQKWKLSSRLVEQLVLVAGMVTAVASYPLDNRGAIEVTVRRA